MNFKTDADKMIQTAEDALAVIELGVSDDDILNKVFTQSLKVVFRACLHQTSSSRYMRTKVISLSAWIPEWWVSSICQRK